MGWRVVVIKYGKKLERAFAGPGGAALRRWIDECPNSLYSALTFQGGPARRRHLTADLGDAPGIRALLARHDHAALGAPLTNTGAPDRSTRPAERRVGT